MNDYTGYAGKPKITTTEKHFQQQIADLAKLLGYKYYHSWLSIHSPRGFPDCVLARAEDKRIVFAELKSDKGQVSPAQQEWIDILRTCGQEVYVWFPQDFEQAVEILRNGRQS